MNYITLVESGRFDHPAARSLLQAVPPRRKESVGYRTFALAVLIASLSACGGGGGGNDQTAQNTNQTSAVVLPATPSPNSPPAEGPTDDSGTGGGTGSGTGPGAGTGADSGSGNDSGSSNGNGSGFDCAALMAEFNFGTGPCVPYAPVPAPAPLPYSAAQQEAHGNEWSMYRGGASHTGYMPVDINNSAITQVWAWNIGADHQEWYGPSWPNIQPVAVGDGKVYVTTGKLGDPHQTIYAIDLQSGTELWNKDLGKMTTLGPPVADIGKVIFSYDSGNTSMTIGSIHHMDFLSSADGSLLKRSSYASQTQDPLPTLFDGTVFSECEPYGGLCSWSISSGTANWQSNYMAQTDSWTPAVDQNYIYAYAPPTCAVEYGCLPSGLYTYRKNSGQLIGYIPASLWGIPTSYGGNFYSAPIIGSRGNVLVAGGYEFMDLSAPVHGAIASFDIPYQRISWQILGNYRGQPALSNGIAYAANLDPMRIEAIDENTGAILWTLPPPPPEERAYVGDPVVTNHHLIYSTNKRVYMVDLRSKQVVWSYPSAAEIAVTRDGHLLLSLAVKVPDTKWLGSDARKPALTTGNIVAFRLN